MRRHAPPASPRRGVVLVVVLFILTALGLLILEVSRNAREQTTRTRLLLERSEARLASKTIESELLLALLTHAWILGGSSDNPVTRPYVEVWRFDGTPFSIGSTSVRIQDVAGQFAMPQPGLNSRLPLVRDLLVELGIEQTRAARTVEFLRYLQEPPLRSPLQDFAQLSGPDKLTLDEVDRLRKVATLYPTSTFNPITAPAPVLKTLFSGSRLDGLISLRETQQLSAGNFGDVVGGAFDPDSLQFSAGPRFQMVISTRGTLADHSFEGVVELDPYSPDPVTWKARRGLSADLSVPQE